MPEKRLARRPTSEVFPTPIGPSIAMWRSGNSFGVGAGTGGEFTGPRGYRRRKTSAAPQAKTATESQPLAVKKAPSTRERSPGFTRTC